MWLTINLTPYVPLSLPRRGGIGYVREASPLFDSPCSGVIIKGKGIQGMGLIKISRL